jgi:ATP-dependent DNA helicase MPH1
MTEGREDGNWDQALSSHQDMQSEIITGRNIELYDDVERLLPDGQDPTCIEQVLSIDPYEPEEKAHNKGKRKAATNAKTPKAKRARGEAVPEGALDGFIMASSLTKNGKKLGSKKKARLSIREDLLPGGDSDTDSANEMTLSQLGRSRSEDSEEEAPPKSLATKASKPLPKVAVASRGKGVKGQRQTSDTDDDSRPQAKKPRKASKPRAGGEVRGQSSRTIAPLPAKKKKNIVVGESDESHTEDEQDPLGLLVTERPTEQTGPRSKAKTTKKSANPKEAVPSSDFSNIDSRWMLDVDDDEFDSRSLAKQSDMKTPSVTKKVSSHSMPPPSFIPARSLIKTPSTLNTSPVPVRKLAKKRVLATSSDGEDGRTRPGSSDAKGEAAVFTSPLITLANRKPTSKKGRHNVLVEEEVEVEGETTMGDDLSGEESESDRRFAGQFHPTQAPQGFNQQAAYLAGLATQNRPGGPDFSDRAGKHDRFLAKARRPVFLSQEDRDPREGPSSEYEGSFVCGDDTVEFETDED